MLLATASLALAGVAAFALQHEIRLSGSARTPRVTVERAQPPALTAEEERYALALWEIQRQVIPAAVAMSYAGISFKMDGGVVEDLRRKIEPPAEFFREAAVRARAMHPPDSMLAVHRQYVEAMGLYSRAADKMLNYTGTGQDQDLVEAQSLSIAASENTLRVGDVLWPGHYRPH